MPRLHSWTTMHAEHFSTDRWEKVAWAEGHIVATVVHGQRECCAGLHVEPPVMPTARWAVPRRWTPSSDTAAASMRRRFAAQEAQPRHALLLAGQLRGNHASRKRSCGPPRSDRQAWSAGLRGRPVGCCADCAV